MRHVKVWFFLLICCLFPLTAYAENKKIIISCAEFTSIEIEQPPAGCPFDETYGDNCFYIAFTMEDATARRLNAELNAYKDVTRELYIEDHLLGTADPFHLDFPYSQKISTRTIHPTLESALDEARRICPNAAIKVPDTVRR